MKLAIAAVILASIGAGQSTGRAFEATIPPGPNFDKAEFKFWVPTDAKTLRGIVVLVPTGRPSP